MTDETPVPEQDPDERDESAPGATEERDEERRTEGLEPYPEDEAPAAG